MALRGPKPKAFLKLVDSGGPGKAEVGNLPDVMDPDFDNQLQPPKKLKKRQAQLWATYIRRAPWLTEFDVPRAYMWVEIQVQFEDNPVEMVAGRIAQLRALGSELGLDPGSRSRIQGDKGVRGKRDPSDKYFT